MTRLAQLLVLSVCLGLGSVHSATGQSACAAPSNWTSHSSVPVPDHSLAPSTNCDFHVWAWQTFLWMTQPDGAGGPRFLGFPTVLETFAAEGAAPVNFTARMALRTLTLTPRVTKSSSPFDSIAQALTDGVLIHRDGRAVYYSINVSSVYYEFIRTKKYYNPTIFESAPPTENFPIGSIEFKYAWRILAAGESASGFFTVPAEVRLLTEVGGKIVVDPVRTEKVTIALVGAHVVGVVKDHPEFIWATFEHQDNAPDLPQGMSADSPNAVSDRDWLFYRAKTPAKDSNQTNAGAVNLADPTKQRLTPVTDVFRQFPWGSQASDASNAADIVALNASVRDRVLANDMNWKNYMLIGATWLPPNSLQPNMSLQNRAVASTRLGNATMETFIQDANCLTCHNTRGATKAGVALPPKNLNLSHVLTDAYFHSKAALNIAKSKSIN